VHPSLTIKAIGLGLVCVVTACSLLVAGCANNHPVAVLGSTEVMESGAPSPSATTSGTTTWSSTTTATAPASPSISPEEIKSLISVHKGSGGSTEPVSVIDYHDFGDWAAAVVDQGGYEEWVAYRYDKGQWTLKAKGAPGPGGDVDERTLQSAGVPQEVMDWFSGGANWGD
jgi:hypothetical protein